MNERMNLAKWMSGWMDQRYVSKKKLCFSETCFKKEIYLKEKDMLKKERHLKKKSIF